MKKVLFPILAVLLALGLALPMAAAAAPPDDKGFDEFGYNYNARLFNSWDGYYDRDIEGGWVPGTNDAWLVMKWSKNWIPMEDQPVGAWCTNHFTWYSDDYDESTWYGWDTRKEWTDKDSIPDTNYKVEEFAKIMRVSDDLDEWARYEAGGAFGVWGTYENGVPSYVVFQDVISVYQKWSLVGDWVLQIDYMGTKYNHDMTIATQTGGSLTGTGGWPAGGPHTITETITGTVSDDGVSITSNYGGSTYQFTAVGTIAADGTMSGTWSSNTGQTGDWMTTSGQATASYDDLIATYDLCTASPKGLGQPIF